MVEKLVFQNACALDWETNNHSYTCFSGRTKKCFKLIIKFHRYYVLFCFVLVMTYKRLCLLTTYFLIMLQFSNIIKTLTCISCLFSKIDNFTNFIALIFIANAFRYNRNAEIWIFNIYFGSVY